MNTKILVPFAPILVESTRSIGYSFEAALADIVDNSISAYAKNVWIDFEQIKTPYLMIIDDGVGMDIDELEIAMTYGSKSSLSKRSENDLGRFGLGLKMASLSQCRILTVFSKKNGEINGASWDLEFIIKKGEWALKQYNKKDIIENYQKIYSRFEKLNSGTIVVWNNFDRIQNSTINIEDSFSKKIEYANSHLTLVFHRYISKEDSKHSLNIFFNNIPLKSYDPFMTSHPKTQKFPEENLVLADQKILVKSYVLPIDKELSPNEIQEKYKLGDLNLGQGFYIYRNKRLIIWGVWYRTTTRNELFKLARIKVDIPNNLDHIWDIDIKKSQASLPDSLRKQLINIVNQGINTSKRTFKHKGRNLLKSSDIMFAWNIIDEREGTKYEINRENELLVNFLEKLNEKDRDYLNIYLDILEETFPYHNVYISSAENNLLKPTSDDDEAYVKAKKIIDSLNVDSSSIRTLLDSFSKLEYFQEHSSSLEKLKGEYL